MIYRQDIINLSAFQDAKDTLEEKDKIVTENLLLSMVATIKNQHQVLADYTSSTIHCRIALLEEYIAVQEYLQLHSDSLRRLVEQQQRIDDFNRTACQRMWDEILDDIFSYFERVEQLMIEEVAAQSSWDTGIKDLMSKGAGIVLRVAKANDKVALGDKSLVERIMDKYLKPDHLGRDISEIIQKHILRFNNEWKTMAEAEVDFRSLPSLFVNVDNAPQGRSDNTSQVFGTGLGGSVVGVLGVAAGWHTLSYAVATVFPPLIVFTALATAATGVLTKDKSIEERKNQIKQVIEYYYRYFHFCLHTQPIDDLRGQTFKKYITNSSALLCNQLKDDQERRLLGKLTGKEFQVWLNSCQRHLQLVRDAMKSIE